MSSTRTWYLLTALALVLAAIEPSAADSRKVQDYWAAGKTSLQRANAHRQLNETQAACEALAKSLDYYRMALAKDELSGHAGRQVSGEGGDAMQEIRSRFGCTGTRAG